MRDAPNVTPDRIRTLAVARAVAPPAGRKAAGRAAGGTTSWGVALIAAKRIKGPLITGMISVSAHNG